jgi:hypothetical protein
VALERVRELAVHGRALQEDEDPTRSHAALRPTYRRVDRLDRPRDHSGDGDREVVARRLELADRDAAQAEVLAGVGEKASSPRAGLDEHELEPGVADLEGDARESGSRPEIQQRRGKAQHVSDDHRVDVVLDHDALEADEPREIVGGVARAQHAMELPQESEPVRAQRDAAALQETAHSFPIGGHAPCGARAGRGCALAVSGGLGHRTLEPEGSARAGRAGSHSERG